MSNLPAKQETFVINIPDTAAPLGFDPNAEVISWDSLDAVAPNYFSEEVLEDVRQSLGGWPVYTINRIEIKLVVDGSKEDKEKTAADLARENMPRPVLYFNETTIGLVLNQSRCKMMQDITGTRNMKQWAELAPPVSLEWGLFNKKGQIGIVAAGEPVHGRQARNGRASGKKVVDDVNEELFGS